MNWRIKENIKFRLKTCKNLLKKIQSLSKTYEYDKNLNYDGKKQFESSLLLYQIKMWFYLMIIRLPLEA